MKPALASIRRLARKVPGYVALAAALSTGISPVVAQPRIFIQPYAEITQGVSVGINDGDSNAFTGLAAGVDARASTRRVHGQVSYRYEKRIGWGKGGRNDDIHNGLAQMRAEVLPGTLNFNAGALATRSRSDGRGPIFGFGTVDVTGVSEIYGLYAGPDFARRVGTIDVAASYRIGYVHVDDSSLRGLPFVPGQIELDRYDSSTTHSATVSIGQGPGPLPFGWTIGGGYAREDLDRLDQDYEAKYIRGDIVLPVSPTLALTAGIGYEKIRSSQQDVLRDSRGIPVITPGGNFIADPARPRLTAFETDGAIYDAGILWRPSRRTELQARAGRRYGGRAVTGTLRYRINSAYGLTGTVYDGVESFGRMLITDLAGVPVSFNIPQSGLNQGVGLGGCVFGTEPGTGTCFDDALQSIATSSFRSRGASLLLSGRRGPWELGAGANYNHRRYFAPVLRSGTVVERITGESFTLNASAHRRFSFTSGVDLNAYAGISDNSLDLIDNSFGLGVAGSYYDRVFHDRVRGTASLGLFHSSSDDFDRTVASALIGLRYIF